MTRRNHASDAIGSVGQVIREARRRKGLSQDQLAALAGVSRGAIRSYEAGERNPGLPKLTEVLAAAGFEPRLYIVEKDTPTADYVAIGRKVVEAVAGAAVS